MRSTEAIKKEMVSNNGHGARDGSATTCQTYFTTVITIWSAAASMADAASTSEVPHVIIMMILPNQDKQINITDHTQIYLYGMKKDTYSILYVEVQEGRCGEMNTHTHTCRLVR